MDEKYFIDEAKIYDYKLVKRAKQELLDIHNKLENKLWKENVCWNYYDHIMGIVNKQLYFLTNAAGFKVGFASLSFYKTNGDFKDEKICLVNELLISINCRNQGLGTVFMNEIEKLAKSKGCTLVKTHCYVDNINGASYYTKHGFREQYITYVKKIGEVVDEQSENDRDRESTMAEGVS